MTSAEYKRLRSAYRDARELQQSAYKRGLWTGAKFVGYFASLIFAVLWLLFR